MRLVAPNSAWTSSFMQQRNQLAALLPDGRIEHIGSTAKRASLPSP
ncbi:GrpB family protein [Actinoplanes sp. NPDC051513]